MASSPSQADAPAAGVLSSLGRESTSSLIAHQLREAIVTGGFAQGARLSEAQLADQLAVSRGPVREALQRLVQEGLLRAERHRGVFVVRLGADDVRDVFIGRAAVEGAAVRVLIGADDAVLAALLERLQNGGVDGTQSDWRTLVDLDVRFHEALVDAAASARLSRMFQTLVAETRMCLLAAAPEIDAWASVMSAHPGIVAALAARDEEQTLRLLDDHLAATARLATPLADA